MQSAEIKNEKARIFIGHFGSGKSEVSVNYALDLKKENKDVILLDFDIVNPFFRSADAEKYLNDQGIRTILPMYANTNVDTPVLTGEVMAAFDDKNAISVFDVGGDDLGAKAVGAFKEKIAEVGYELFFVCNVYRPMTDTIEKLHAMFAEVCETAGLNATGIVNNTNLLEETTGEIIYEGHQMLTEFSKQIGVPIKMTAGKKSALDEFESLLKERGEEPEYMKYLAIDKMIDLPWNS